MLTTHMGKTKTGVVDVIRTSNKIETKIQNMHKEGLKLAKDTAIDHAGKNLPGIKSKSNFLLRFLCAFYNQIVIESKSALQVTNEQFHAKQDIAEFNENKKRLLDKLPELNNQLRIEKRNFDNLKSASRKMIINYRSQAAILLLTGTEMLFASSSLQLISNTKLFAWALGLTLAIALYTTATVTAKLLRRYQHDRHRFIITCVIVATILSSVFYTLGSYRVAFITTMSDSTGMENYLSPLSFCLIQLFLFSIAIVIKYFSLLSEVEKENFYQWKKAKATVSKLEKECRSIENQIKEMEQKLKQSLIARKTLISYAADLERRICAFYQEAGQEYVKANIHYRSGDIPPLFELDDLLPPLTLYFQDEAAMLKFNDATGQL